MSSARANGALDAQITTAATSESSPFFIASLSSIKVRRKKTTESHARERDTFSQFFFYEAKRSMKGTRTDVILVSLLKRLASTAPCIALQQQCRSRLGNRKKSTVMSLHSSLALTPPTSSRSPQASPRSPVGRCGGKAESASFPAELAVEISLSAAVFSDLSASKTHWVAMPVDLLTTPTAQSAMPTHSAATPVP